MRVEQQKSISFRRLAKEASALVFIFCLLTVGCRHGTSLEQDQRRISPIRHCGLSDFSKTETEHVIEEITETFFVSNFRGAIAPRQGQWPRDHVVILEIRNLEERGTKARRVPVNENGTFSQPDVAQGTYCFKASAIGWSSVMGTIQVTREAGTDSLVEIRLPLAQ